VKKLLYIEDEKAQATVISRLFETVDCKFFGEVKCDLAHSWEEGIRMIALDPPDVVLIDLTLPDSSEPETIERIRAVTSDPGFPPVLVFTANAIDLGLRARCIMAGADDFVVKDARPIECLCERAYHCHLRRITATLRGSNHAKPA
jgi:CheY-like chemotaxis protein